MTTRRRLGLELMQSALILLGFLLLSVYSFPLYQLQPRQLAPFQVAWVTSYSTTFTETSVTEVVSVNPPDQSSGQTSAMRTPFFIAPIIPILPSDPDPLIDSTTTSTFTDTLSEISTSFVYEPPVTVTLTQAPTTVTDTVVVSQTPGNYWAAPAQFSDLDSFKITHFACGEQNLEIVNNLPANASEADNSTSVDPAKIEGYPALLPGDYLDDSTNSTSLLQLFYPANSINPGNSPVGGADFYATPLPLASASNVTLEYSVYFPEAFDWVYGGKLPGLYGGHETCSGGDAATSCFSTRLMWRPGGAGELYLYAPKDKQTYALCHTPPQSVCDEAYGLSVGRGSFNFTPGAWTTVRQTVALNTPGQQDGGFVLEVDGEVVIERSDVFYRDVPSAPTPTVTSTTSSTSSANPDADADDGGNPDASTSDGLLSPLVSGVLGPLGAIGGGAGVLSVLKDSGVNTNSSEEASEQPALLPLEEDQPFADGQATDDAAAALMSSFSLVAASMTLNSYLPIPAGYTSPTTVLQQPTITVASYSWSYPTDGAAKAEVAQNTSTASPIPFTGLFFSTFFGGSSKKYATPDDQYTWFKDFSITINA